MLFLRITKVSKVFLLITCSYTRKCFKKQNQEWLSQGSIKKKIANCTPKLLSLFWLIVENYLYSCKIKWVLKMISSLYWILLRVCLHSFFFFLWKVSQNVDILQLLTRSNFKVLCEFALWMCSFMLCCSILPIPDKKGLIYFAFSSSFCTNDFMIHNGAWC